MASAYASDPATPPDHAMAKRKLVVVGDGGCGKTSLLIVYSEHRFPEDYVPTIFDNYLAQVHFHGHPVELALWDTAGQEEYDRLRPLSYPESNVILICFAVDFPTSLMNVQDKWYPEINHFLERVPIVLVGLKTDLRTDPHALAMLKAQGTTPVSSAQGQKVAADIGAAAYVECSARLNQGVQQVFDTALSHAMGMGQPMNTASAASTPSVHAASPVAAPTQQTPRSAPAAPPRQTRRRKRQCQIL